jgi:hypothetical protein
VVLLVIAIGIVVVPLVRRYLPDGIIEVNEDLANPWLLYLVAIVGCVSSAFWWSVVTIDPKADQVEILSRWGLCSSKYRRALSFFDTVTLRQDSDSNVSVYLEGSTRDWLIEANNNKAIVWGRSYKEARELAAILANHLHLRLDDHVAPQRVG